MATPLPALPVPSTGVSRCWERAPLPLSVGFLPNKLQPDPPHLSAVFINNPRKSEPIHMWCMGTVCSVWNVLLSIIYWSAEAEEAFFTLHQHQLRDSLSFIVMALWMDVQ